jgi:hypothetical protein
MLAQQRDEIFKQKPQERLFTPPNAILEKMTEKKNNEQTGHDDGEGGLLWAALSQRQSRHKQCHRKQLF